jgi:hypothetical protein
MTVVYPVASHAAGEKMEPVKVDKVISSENFLIITDFKIRSEKNPVANMER